MRPLRARQPEQVGDERLAGGRREQVVAADDHPDPLGGVVDDDREVVGEGAVATAQDEVVDDVGALAVEAVHEPDLGALGPQADRERLPGVGAPAGLRGADLAARPRVGVLGLAVMGGRRLADLAPRAEAPVGQPGLGQARQRRPVELAALGLAHDLAVPVEADRAQIVELLGDEALPHAPRVEILDPDQERRPGCAREQPREQRRSQVAEVQLAGR